MKWNKSRFQPLPATSGTLLVPVPSGQWWRNASRFGFAFIQRVIVNSFAQIWGHFYVAINTTQRLPNGNAFLRDVAVCCDIIANIFFQLQRGKQDEKNTLIICSCFYSSNKPLFITPCTRCEKSSQYNLGDDRGSSSGLTFDWIPEDIMWYSVGFY